MISQANHSEIQAETFLLYCFPEESHCIWLSEASSLCFFILVYANTGQSQNIGSVNQTHQVFLPYSSKKTVADCLFCFSLVLYLEGSVLVFEDIFKLVAFYCVSR